MWSRGLAQCAAVLLVLAMVSPSMAGNSGSVTDVPGTDTSSTVADVAYLEDEPVSSVNAVSGYWRNTAPLGLTAAASASGNATLTNVTLHYRFSSNNATWGAWIIFNTDAASPWNWNFTYPSGNGYYQFYSIARDDFLRVEAAPAVADARAGYDTAPPEHMIGVPILKQTNLNPCNITSRLGDFLSGMASHSVYYSYGSPMGPFILWGITYTSTFSFNWPMGTGTYYFEYTGYDKAGNFGPAAASYDDYWQYDATAPTSTCDVSGTYWRSLSPVTITATATDSGSGLASVALWYRFSADNATFGAWTLYAADTTSPYSWSFPFSEGSGFYQFYSRATDNVGNTEAIPATADLRYGYDSARPYSSIDIFGPYWRNTSPVTISVTAADSPAGIASVVLFYRYGAVNGTFGSWTQSGAADTTSPYAFNFLFSSGQGYYEFYALATDLVGNTEIAPATADLRLGYDFTSPVSAVNAIVPYEQYYSIFTVDAISADALSGTASIALHYRFSPDNSSWGSWLLFGTDYPSPWSWSFNCPSGPGYYQFYSHGTDLAGNGEPAPAVHDSSAKYAIAPPPMPITDLLATPHQPTAADVQLEWSEIPGATQYNIYRSVSVRGDGFNFAAPYADVAGDGIGKIIWVDVAAYATASNYSWVVKPVIGGTEYNTSSNPAWKLVITLRQGTGIAGASNNYISLPSKLNITLSANLNNAAALIGDMRAYGSPVNSVSSVNRWDQNNSIWQARTAFVGTNFALKPGEGYRVIVTVAAVTYKIVGAHNPNLIYNLFRGTGPAGADSNYISLPYHYSFTTTTASGLISNLRTAGTPTNSVTSVNRWNQDTSVWEARAAFAGINFALKPGECYRVVVSQVLVTWTCPTATPGG